MAPKDLPSRALAYQRLHHNADSGALIWQKAPRKAFNSDRGFLSWNARHPGNIAGSITVWGYRVISINSISYMAHRLVWLMAYGKPVPELIDHIDGNKDNNRLENLRAATKGNNATNGKLRTDNPLGVKGVTLHKSGRYRVQIHHDKVKIDLGYFDTLEEAAAVRREAAERLHGPFARHE